MGKYSDASPFVEGQAIIAAQEDDYMELHKILESMLPNERRSLKSAARRLYTLLERNYD